MDSGMELEMRLCFDRVHRLVRCGSPVLSGEHHLGIPQLGRRGVVKIVGDSVGWG